MGNMTLNRRAVIGGSGIVAIALATPLAAGAVSTAPQSSRFATLMRANAAAVRRFNSLPENLDTDDLAAFEAEEQTMFQASRLADRATPTTWQEFARWIEHITDNGHSAVDDDNAERLLMHTRRLAKMDG